MQVCTTALFWDLFFVVVNFDLIVVVNFDLRFVFMLSSQELQHSKQVILP